MADVQHLATVDGLVTRYVLRAGWIAACEVRENDLVHLDCSEWTRSEWCRVLEVEELAPGDPAARWGRVRITVACGYEPREGPVAADESPYHGPDQWRSQLLPADRLVEVLA